ncbi:MAG: nuclear transport factor 2 family protein [Planctomycetes bacterium]|nr:nuclear transport factor 2 family protein [Planctomycetota bacterium]
MAGQQRSCLQLLRRLILAVVMVSLSAAGGAPSYPERGPKDLVQEVLDAQVAAWNKGDLESFMVGYWKSPDLSFFSGSTKTRGWQATLDRYRARYQAEGQEMGKLTFSEIEIDVLGPDGAWVRGRWKLVTSKETLGGLFTLVFKRTPDGWRIVHDHTSA